MKHIFLCFIWKSNIKMEKKTYPQNNYYISLHLFLGKIKVTLMHLLDNITPEIQ